MKEIAVYGKGGIGKSTLSANLSAALSVKGEKVLQIGCDPKHDSTKLLLKGKHLTTVLDYIRSTSPADYKVTDVLQTGYNGIGCIEAGGPEPGVGCAGRGIITSFEFLQKFQIKENYDIIVYDVLGDVVCGGFAVPIRREYADTIFIVTSGEYMALYAANNILRGIRNYDGDQCRVAGLLFNSRNVSEEDERVAAFAQAVGLPVFAKIPRTDMFAQAERENLPISALNNEIARTVSDIFYDTADRILAGPKLYPPKPLTDEQLEELLLYRRKPVLASSNTEQKTAPEAKPESKPEAEDGLLTAQNTDASVQTDNSTVEEPSYDSGYLSKNVLRGEPLHGCAFNGAMTMGVHLTDAVVLAHSPRSCIYLSFQSLSSSGRRNLFERGSLLPTSLMPNICSTNMDENDIIFGGTNKLFDAVQEIRQMDPPPRAIIIVSSCPAGIIGDDIDKAKTLSTPELPVVTIKADGNLNGDYLQGMLMSYTQLAKQIIDQEVPVRENTVNIVFEKVVANNTERNFQTMTSYLSAMGIRVNCRFLCNTTYDALRDFCSAPLNLLAYKDYTGQILEEFFKKEYNSTFYENQFPVGFSETAKWLQDIGAFFGQDAVADSIIEEHRKLYAKRVEKIRPLLKGKKLMVITRSHELDWILQTALDVGIEIVKLCIRSFSQDENFRSNLPDINTIPLEENYDPTKGPEDIAAYRPDILLSDYDSPAYENCLNDTIPMCPDTGFFSGILTAERWAGLFHTNLEGAWKNDQHLFDKYYAR